jgi:hypothetical protein
LLTIREHSGYNKVNKVLTNREHQERQVKN